MVYSGVGGVVDAAIFDASSDDSSDDECRRRASAFKEREEPSGESSRLSSGVLHAYLLDCLRGEDFNYRLQLLPGQLDGELSPIIVLATVV
jgi:hypothetical protein